MTHTKSTRSLLMAGAGTLALMLGACSSSLPNIASAKKAPAKEVRSAASLMRLGDSTAASGAMASAARFYDAAAQAAPKDPVPRMRLARTLQVMGAHSAAIAAYQAALALKPDITDAERGIGDVDEDGDIDLWDIAVMANCFSDADASLSVCDRFDREPDSVIDLSDAFVVLGWMTGPRAVPEVLP